MLAPFSEILAVEDRPHSISELAERFDVTLRTIRFYEQRGLIAPERADPHTRVFHGKDVARLGFIIACRRLGLGVEAIASLLEARDRQPPKTFRKTLKSALEAHRNMLESTLVDLQNQRRCVTTWLDELSDAA